MERLDEASLRRPDFRPGYAVELADGGRYTFPPVSIRIFPDDDGSVQWRPWYDGDLEDDLDVLFGVVPARSGQVIEVRLRIAAALLRRNYDLPRGAVGRLLTYIPGDAASEARYDRVSRAILGRDPDAVEDDEDEDAPDPKGEGDASAATPTSSG
jgi:hypothetical protein